MIIEKAKEYQYEAVRAFYHSLIDDFEGDTYDIGWKKDIYPEPEFLMNSIVNGQLFVGILENQIIAAMVLNHEYNESYNEYEWEIKATKDEVLVIHALGIAPQQTRKGYAKQLVKYAIEYAKLNKQKVIRLDVLKGNLPAEKFYSCIGFKYLHTLPMYYEDTGWTDYELYEFRI